MPEPSPGLPKYPGAEIERRNRELARLVGPDQTRDTLRDRLRHAFPAAVLVAVFGVAGFILLGLAVGAFSEVFRRAEGEFGRAAAVLFALAPVFLLQPVVAVLAARLQARRNRLRTDDPGRPA